MHITLIERYLTRIIITSLVVLLEFSWSVTSYSGDKKEPGQAMMEYVRGIEVEKESGRRRFIKDRLQEFGVPYSVMSFDTSISYNGKIRDFSGENIIVSFGSAKEKIVIGAHLDAVFAAPGANDNGSGVAVLLQLIHDLKDHAFAHRIDFCFFDLEEPGLIGSSVYVRRYDTNYAHLAMINLDVEGTGSEIYAGPIGGKHHGLILNYVHLAEDQTHYAYYEDKIIPETDCDSFGDAGMENISLSVVPPGEGKKISELYRDPAGVKEGADKYPSVLKVMHTKNDTSALVQPEALTMAYIFAAKTLLLLDENEK